MNLKNDNFDINNKTALGEVLNEFKDRNDYYEFTTKMIQTHFELIKSDIQYPSFYLDCEYNKIEDLSIMFSFKDEKFGGRAHLKDNHIEINLDSFARRGFKNLIIHEIAHFICYWNNLDGDGFHTLDFAIVNYCLRKRILGKQDNYLDSYDIHEDNAYSLLSINMCQFDSFINSIEWNTIEELCRKAKSLAIKIRRKAMAL